MDDHASNLAIVNRETTSSAGIACPTTAAGENPFEDVEKTLGLVGDSSAILQLRRSIRRMAKTRLPVLVTGESGTGKELVARALHARGSNPEARFVAVNAATLHGSLVQSELFGHERGAFTGATASRRGLFELAHGGTLFVDEIGELDPTTQAELLRVLETGELRPVGSERVRKVSFRLIAATHRDLGARDAPVAFREDLLYRLRVLVIHVPTLAERDLDFPALVDHLLDRLVPAVGRKTITDAAVIRLADSRWPGNVRQLQHVLARACVLSDATELGVEEVEEALVDEAAPPPKPPPVATESPTDAAIQTALRTTKGSISGAARLLGIPRSTLRDRLTKRNAKPD